MNLIKTTSTFFALLSLNIALSCAQGPTTSTMPTLNIAPSSPDAAALGKYGEIPVGLYTGVPNISVPLYTISLRGFQLPISLSYHAAGIKVDENAGSTGMNWSLNFGGSVTCAVNGLPDLLAGSGSWINATAGHRVPQTSIYQSEWLSTDSWATDTTYLKLLDAANEIYDTQPDIFYLGYNSSSVKFYWDQVAAAFVTMPYTQVGINGDVDGFQVTDEHDNHFDFSSVELSRTDYTHSGASEFTTRPHHTEYLNYSYYPTSIVTPLGDSVRYEYEHYSYQFDNQVSESRYSNPNTQPGINLESYATPAPGSTSSTTHILDGLRVKKIKTNTGLNIVFTYGLTRTDLTGTKALTGISVQDSVHSIVLCSYTLAYDYSSSRLRLISVTKDSDPPHLFEYNSGTVSPVLSKSQDHWGYTGNGNSSLLPADPAHGFFTGANREPTAAVLYGLLNKITYPAGGYSTFEYEPNKAVVTGDSISHHSAIVHAASNSTQTASFTVGSNAYAASFRASYNAGEDGNYHDPSTDQDYLCVVRLKDGSNNVVGSFSGTASETPLAPIAAGNYVLSIQTNATADFSPVYVQIDWEEYNGLKRGNATVGGARIKTIEDHPVIGTPLARHYEYNRLDTPSLSSGVTNWVPRYVYSHTVLEKLIGASNPTVPYYFWAQSSSSVSPLGTVQGGAVGYTQVTEYTGDKSNGYSASIFTPPANSSSSIAAYPFPPIISYDWQSGLLLQKTDYKWTDSTYGYRPLKKVKNVYAATPANPAGSSYFGAKIVVDQPGVEPDLDPATVPIGPRFTIAWFQVLSVNRFLSETTETLYDPADTSKKTLGNQKYYYDNPAHLQVTRQEIAKSNGEQYKLLLRYPKDIDSYYAYNSSPVVEKRIMINNGSADRLVGDELTLYRNHAGAMPLSYYSLNAGTALSTSAVPLYSGTVDAALEKRLGYTYSGNNVSSVLKDEALRTSYHWGYNDQHPVAGCTNALETEFFYEDFEVSGNATGGHTGKKYKANGSAYTVSWTKPNSRDYVISYWYKASGTWHYSGEIAYTGTSYATGQGDVDDIRIHPKDAQMTTYTYEPLVGISSQTDAKGQTVYYEYDASQRLKAVRDQDGNIVRTMDYHYKN